MTPVLEPNQEVLVTPRRRPQPGDVVVATHPIQSARVVIKALQGYDERGNMILVGLNAAASTDSRTLGGVPMSKLIGVATSVL